MSELFNRYYELLERRMECIKEIKALLEAQSNLMACDDFIGLEKLFNETDKKMRECDAIKEQLGRIDTSNISEEKLMQIEKLESSIKEMLNEIILINGSLQEKAQEKLEEYRSNIKKINEAKKGLNAYGAAERHIGSFYFDKKN